MRVFKRGGVYWYKFKFNGEMIRESSKQGNAKVARDMEAAHRTSLAKGVVGIREKKAAPTLNEFTEKRFLPWAKTTFEESRPNSWNWFRTGVRQLTSFEPLARLRLDEINNEKVAGYAAHESTRVQMRGNRQKMGLAISSINSSVRVLRRILNIAVEWGVIESAPKIQLLNGEKRREHVITREEEDLYLAAASPLLFDLATILADTGTRPDEAYNLRWEHINWSNGRHGTLLIPNGKTAAARRVLPLTLRVRAVLERRWTDTKEPAEGWVFPAPTKTGHINQASIKKHHYEALKEANRIGKAFGKKVRPFVLYSFRHTFLTRLGESGCDVWTLARIAGHSSITISSRYVHPSEDAVLNAITRMSETVIEAANEAVIEGSIEGRVERETEKALGTCVRGRHKNGHSRKQAQLPEPVEELDVVDSIKEDGAPEKIRTSDLTLRRRSLYPAELRARSLRI